MFRTPPTAQPMVFRPDLPYPTAAVQAWRRLAAHNHQLQKRSRTQPPVPAEHKTRRRGLCPECGCSCVEVLFGATLTGTSTADSDDQVLFQPWHYDGCSMSDRTWIRLFATTWAAHQPPSDDSEAAS